MKTIRLTAILACLSLAGCYDFDFPLDASPSVPVDPRLLATWRCLATDGGLDDEPAALRITRSSDTVSRWTFFNPSDDTDDKGEFDVYASTLGGATLLNALEKGEKDHGKWSFVRYTLLTSNILRLELVDDEPFAKEKSDASALRGAIEKRVNDATIYKDFCVCARLRNASPGPSSEMSPTPRP